MRYWIDIILFIVVIILILPSLVVGLFSTKEPHEPPPDFQDQSDRDIIHVQNSKEEYIEHTITLYNHYTKTLEDMPLEEYVVGVVAAEMPSSFEMEALKAQAVAARTLAVRKLRSYGDAVAASTRGRMSAANTSIARHGYPSLNRERTGATGMRRIARRLDGLWKRPGVTS